MLHHHSAKLEAIALQAELNRLRANSAATVQANLLNAAELPELVRVTVARFGRLDVLVNNASTFHPTPLGEIKLADWDDLIGTNLRAPLFLSQAAAPHLRSAGGRS